MTGRSPQGAPLLRNCQGSYVARHWRGDLPLGISYWINGLLVTIVTLIVTRITTLAEADMTQAPRLIAGSFAAFVALLAILSVWQLVGIWRSAGRRIEDQRRNGRRAFWATCARIATGFGFVSLGANAVTHSIPNAAANLEIAFGNDPTPHHILRVVNRGSEILLTGGIDFGTAGDLRTLLDSMPTVRTIDFNNMGGRVAEANRVRDLIRKRHLATYTDATCASACTIAYMGGDQRYLGPNGRLVFHRYSFPGLTADQDAAANRRGEQDLIRFGVSPDFAARAFRVASSDFWQPDQDILLAAHVVTQKVSHLYFAAIASGGQLPTTESFDQNLAASASFAVLKRVDPQGYFRAVEAVVTGVQQGRSMVDILPDEMAPLFAAFSRFRSLAEDDVQVRLAHLTSEMAGMLASDHPDSCLALLLNGNVPSYGMVFPRDLLAQYNAVLADVIEEGFSHPVYGGLSERDATVEIMRLWSRVRDSGVDLSTVGKTPVTSTEQRSICLAMAAFLAEVVGLPAQRAGALMRYLARRA